MANFALIGAAGFIAPRHMQAIHETGNTLVAAVDPHDCVGRIDSYFPDARFFTEIERFDRYLEKLRRGPEESRVQYVSVCSPNYLHDAHVRLALRVKADAICEKPMVLSPWNLDALADLEAEYGSRVHAVLQLRLIEKLHRRQSVIVISGWLVWFGWFTGNSRLQFQFNRLSHLRLAVNVYCSGRCQISMGGNSSRLALLPCAESPPNLA